MDSQRRTPSRHRWLINAIAWNGKSLTDRGFSLSLIGTCLQVLITISSGYTIRIRSMTSFCKPTSRRLRPRKSGDHCLGIRIWGMDQRVYSQGYDAARRTRFQQENITCELASKGEYNCCDYLVPCFDSGKYKLILCTRSLLQTICFYTVLHDRLSTGPIDFRHSSFGSSSSRNDFKRHLFNSPTVNHLHPDHSFSLHTVTCFWCD